MDLATWRDNVVDEPGSPMLIRPYELHNTTTDDEFLSTTDANDVNRAYASLEFPDCTYMVKTVSILIGRDTTVQRMLELAQHNYATVTLDGEPINPSKQNKQSDSADSSSDSEANVRTRRNIPIAPDGHYSKEGGIVAAAGEAIEDEDEPFVPIHPPTNLDGSIPNLKSISKNHLRICFTEEEGWKMEVLGRNGAFLNGDWHAPDTSIVLENWDVIAISGLEFTFHLGSVEHSRESSEAAEDYMDAAEDGHMISLSSSRKGPYKRRHSHAQASDSEDEDDSEQDDEKDDEERANEPRAKIKLKLSKPGQASKKRKREDLQAPTSHPALDGVDPPMDPPKKRGPGRPPKNGFMSQREIRERRKAAKLAESNPDAAGDADRNAELLLGVDGLPDLDAPKKRKYTKRNSLKLESESGVANGSSNNADDAKGTLARRSPTPKREDFSEEQLRKPNETYVTLLYQVLSEMKEPQPLQQIYKAIKKRWPFYAFVDTDGWQSSVRHNLLQTDCFRKAAKEGKGHLWELVPGSTLGTKKRRNSPPPPSQPRRGTALPPTPANISRYQQSPLHYQHGNVGPYAQASINSFGPTTKPSNLPGSLQAGSQHYNSPYDINAAGRPGQAGPPGQRPNASTGGPFMNQAAGQPLAGFGADMRQSFPRPLNKTDPTHPPTPSDTARNNLPAASSPSSHPANGASHPASVPPGNVSSPAPNSSRHGGTPQGPEPNIFARFRSSYLGLVKTDEERNKANEDINNAIARIMRPYDHHPPANSNCAHLVNVLAGLVQEQSRTRGQGPRPTSQTPAPVPRSGPSPPNATSNGAPAVKSESSTGPSTASTNASTKENGKVAVPPPAASGASPATVASKTPDTGPAITPTPSATT